MKKRSMKLTHVKLIEYYTPVIGPTKAVVEERYEPCRSNDVDACVLFTGPQLGAPMFVTRKLTMSQREWERYLEEVLNG